MNPLQLFQSRRNASLVAVSLLVCQARAGAGTGGPPPVDPTRAAQGIVIGGALLGAGVIMKKRHKHQRPDHRRVHPGIVGHGRAGGRDPGLWQRGGAGRGGHAPTDAHVGLQRGRGLAAHRSPTPADPGQVRCLHSRAGCAGSTAWTTCHSHTPEAEPNPSAADTARHIG